MPLLPKAGRGFLYGSAPVLSISDVCLCFCVVDPRHSWSLSAYSKIFLFSRTIMILNSAWNDSLQFELIIQFSEGSVSSRAWLSLKKKKHSIWFELWKCFIWIVGKSNDHTYLWLQGIQCKVHDFNDMRYYLVVVCTALIAFCLQQIWIGGNRTRWWKQLHFFERVRHGHRNKENSQQQ